MTLPRMVALQEYLLATFISKTPEDVGCEVEGGRRDNRVVFS